MDDANRLEERRRDVPSHCQERLKAARHGATSSLGFLPMALLEIMVETYLAYDI
jgi:hypothetical protein